MVINTAKVDLGKSGKRSVGIKHSVFKKRLNHKVKSAKSSICRKFKPCVTPSKTPLRQARRRLHLVDTASSRCRRAFTSGKLAGNKARSFLAKKGSNWKKKRKLTVPIGFNLTSNKWSEKRKRLREERQKRRHEEELKQM